MLKLMKYEFRKLRTVLLVMLIALVALELGFILGDHFGKFDVSGICLGLLTALTFAAYLYLMISAIVSYSRELTDKSGYLIFMSPVRPISVVLSKLLFTLLAGLAATALFGAAAYLDYAYLFRRLTIDADTLQQFNFLLRVTVGDVNISIDKIGYAMLFGGLTVLINVMLFICTAYLSITLSATLLQNKKNFLRALVSFALFAVLYYCCNRLTGLLLDWVRNAVTITSMNDLMRVVGAELALNLAFCAIFCWTSAELLKRKVSL